MRSAALFLVTIVLLAAGAATVVAAPRYQVTTASPAPSPLFVIEQPPPTPSPSPTPAPTLTTTTAPPATTNPAGTVTFPMPVYKQVMALDCETAALQMGLAAMGHTYSQQALFAGQNPDNSKPVMGPNKKVIRWGNPYVNFVGDVNGSDLVPSGYGVYYPPILAIARSHGAPSSTGGENLSAAQVYAAVAAGHPVVVWVETGWENARAAGYTGFWTTFDGSRQIKYSLIEHAVTLSGVSVTQIRVNDPWKSGSQYWFNKAAFEASWADFNNMAVILQ
ncbi:MAG: C39 family peptidase [Candidatus Dormibacteraeota bacterium]|nr:C39 family peptidase [Candidatus Dormibacteraeota bacterium]